MARQNLLVAFALLLIPACGGRAASETMEPSPSPVVDAGAEASDSVSPPDASFDAFRAPDSSVILAACEGCLALHCAAYGECERDPHCAQALTRYIDCTRQTGESTCSRILENDPAVPGDVTICLAAYCETDCSAQ
jgi:hypothetical protein